jgi:hypothetical protein
VIMEEAPRLSAPYGVRRDAAVPPAATDCRGWSPISDELSITPAHLRTARDGGTLLSPPGDSSRPARHRFFTLAHHVARTWAAS